MYNKHLHTLDMCSYFQIGSFFLLLFFPFSLTLTNTCNSYFPVENSITNTSFLTHTLSIPQILTTDGYTPGIGYVFTIETRNNAVINTFLFQVQNQGNTILIYSLQPFHFQPSRFRTSWNIYKRQTKSISHNLSQSE